MTGSLIAFEGSEGAGKSTQLRLAADALRRDGFRVEVTVEPGGTHLGREIRRLLLHDPDVTPTPWAELFLILADRAQHVSEVIQPALDAGAIVLTDRFSGSTLAYQGYGRGLDLSTVTALERDSRQGIAPSLTVLLDCPVHIGLPRARERDRFHQEEVRFHERVRSGFLALAAADPHGWHIVDATQTEAQVHEQIMSLLRRHLPRR